MSTSVVWRERPFEGLGGLARKEFRRCEESRRVGTTKQSLVSLRLLRGVYPEERRARNDNNGDIPCKAGVSPRSISIPISGQSLSRSFRGRTKAIGSLPVAFLELLTATTGTLLVATNLAVPLVYSPLFFANGTGTCRRVRGVPVGSSHVYLTLCGHRDCFCPADCTNVWASRVMNPDVSGFITLL